MAGPIEAMRLHRCGETLRRDRLTLPDPAPDQVLIEVEACGVCRTDLHVVDGELPDPPGSPALVPILRDRVGRTQTLRISIPRALAEVPKIRGVLALAPQEGWKVPILKTEAARGEGVEALAEKLREHRAHVEAEGTLSERRRRNLMNEVLGIASMRLRRALEESMR